MATKVANNPVDPVRKFRFEVQTISGANFIPAGRVGFTEVSGLNLGDTEVIEYVDGNDVSPRKLPGRTKFGNVTLKKGVDAGRHLTDWREIVMECLGDEGGEGLSAVPRMDVDNMGKRNPEFRADLLITLYDRSTASGPDAGRVRARWIVRGAWPISLTTDALTSEGGILMEDCVLATERIVQTYPKRGSGAA